MRFIFKTRYEQDIQLVRHEGHAFWYGMLGVLLLLSPWLLDEYWLDLPGLLPSLPTIISNGLVPLALLLLGLVGYYEFNRRAFKATKCEAVLSVFVLILFGFLALTAIGIWFRGSGMALMWPWEVTVALH